MQDRRRAICLLSFWLATLCVSVLALAPPPYEVHLAPSDKIDHLFAFLVLTMLAIFAYPRNRILIVPLGLVAFGGFLELVQATSIVHRDASLNDWLVDILGVGLGMVGGVFARAMLNPRQGKFS